MGGGVLHGSGLHEVGLSGGALHDGGPRKSSGVHGALVTGLAERRRALGLLHAQDERPGGEGGVAGGDGVDIAGQLVLGAKLVQIAGALILAVLAGPRAVRVLLGVTIRNLHIQEKEY